MNLKWLSVVLFVTMSTSYADMPNSFGQDTLSDQYSIEIEVQSCERQRCSGPGIIRLYRKNSKDFVQEFQSDDLNFWLDDDANVSTHVERYDERSPVLFGDFNFDNREDIAVKNGHRGAYGSPSYDIYVASKGNSHFLFDSGLTELASNHLGIFQVVEERASGLKGLLVNNKDGCCYHESFVYEVISGDIPRQIYHLIVDSRDPDWVMYTEKRWENGQWTEYQTREPRENIERPKSNKIPPSSTP